MKQKTTLTRSRWLFACLLSLLMPLGGSSPAWGDELTVHDGSNTHESIPFNAYNADSGYGDKGEFVIPASDLTSINGKTLTGLKFYTNLNVSLTGTFQVFLKEVASTTLSSLSGTTGATTVYTGTLAATSNVMTINFSSNYVYGGGNLLVGIYMTKKGNCSSYGFAFKGTTTEENNAYYSYGYSSAGTATFIPKTTIITQTEGPGFEVKDGSTTIESPFAYNFGLAESGDTKVFTLSNPGTEATPISVNTTGANGFTATVEGNATSIPAGETKTLTITMPDATASGSIVVTPTGDGLSAFTFNVNGTKRDPNKVYLDFSDGQMPDGWSWVPIGSYASNYSCSVHEGYISWAQYGGSSYAWAFTSPKLNFENGELIAFETAKYGSSTSYNPSVTVEYSLDGNTWTAIGSAFTDDTYGNWTKRSVNIPVDGVKYIRFNGWYIHMRKIYGGELPLNPTPKDFAYSNVTNTSAQLSWSYTASNFNIQYKADGAGDWTTIENVTENPYTLTGLSAVTTYQVRVQADHGVNGLSDYTDPISFTTKPDPISAYPYTENFNSLSSGEIPQYWDNSEGTTTTASYKWVYYVTGHDGACLRFNSYYNSYNTNFLKTRPFNFTEGQPMKLSFWYKNPTGGDFSVYASTDGGSTYPTELATGLTGKSDWTLKEIDIPAAIYGSNVVIVFKGTSNDGSGDAYLYLDDVTISEVSDYSLAISGSDVSESTIAFGTVKNTTTTKTFTINNDGSADLTSISVVSSDPEVFTVSETGFDLASGASKDITVTFVKATEADYNETITISQTNVATPIELTVTATYVTPTPATMDATLDEAAIGASVDFGTVNKATVKTFKVTNTGEATLNATIAITGTDAAKFTPSTTSLVVAGKSNETFTITFNSDDEDDAKTATVTLSAAGLSDVSFDVTGTYSNFWTEDFEGGALPDYWATTGWTISNSTPGYAAIDNYVAWAGTSSSTFTLTTPRLQATAGDELTFIVGDGTDGTDKLTVEYSNDLSSWTAIDGSPFTSGGTKTFTAPADGYYYLKFNGKYASLDNFEGFKLAIPAHIMAITASNIPTSGLKEGQAFNATVDVKENRGVAENGVIAKLYMNSVVIGTSTATDFEANESKQITIPCTPTTGADDASMYIEVVYASGSETVSTTPVNRNVAAITNLTLDEGSSAAISAGTYDNLTLVRKFTVGWNTVCLPFTISGDGAVEAFFGDGAKAYRFSGFTNGDLEFTTTSSLTASYPYIVYVPSAITEDIELHDITIAAGDVTAFYQYQSGAYFRGTYVPIAAGDWTKTAGDDKLYGVTAAGKIAKIGDTATSKGFRGYFDLPAGATTGARLSFFDETTGITTVMDAKELNNDGKVYNLNGQRVENAHKGLYIVNGRKVVVK